jgi:hypothetical protein
MAELLKDGSIRMRDGRILWGKDIVQIIDVFELNELLTPAPKGAGGGFGGGRGARGAQGPPGVISIVQDEGFNLPSQNTLNFIGGSVSVVNDPGNGRLNITVNDIYAATRVVSLTPGEGTDLTIASAVAALPAEGGTIFIKQGTYPVAATIIIPDKDVTFAFSGGAKITTTGLGANPLFKSNTGLTAIRKLIFWSPTAVGENLATAQYFLELADVNSRCLPEIYSPNITQFRRVFNISAADLAYIVPAIIKVIGGRILPPNVSSTLVKSPLGAGTYDAGRIFYATNCRLLDDSDLTLGWILDFDGDLFLTALTISITGASKVDGLTCSETVINGGAGASLEVLGGSFDSYNTISAWLLVLTLKLSAVSSKAIGCQLNVGGTIVVNAGGVVISGLSQHINNIVAIAVDILAGANYCVVDGSFADCTTAAIRTAAQRTTIGKSTFASTGTNKTILEAGAADRTLVTGCNGIASGGGFTIPGANSLVGADNIG